MDILWKPVDCGFTLAKELYRIPCLDRANVAPGKIHKLYRDKFVVNSKKWETIIMTLTLPHLTKKMLIHGENLGILNCLKNTLSLLQIHTKSITLL